MKLIKNIFLTLTTLIFLASLGLFLYVKTLPTAPPDFIDSAEVNMQQTSAPFQCSSGNEFEYAYQVNVSVESILNQKKIYQSKLKFNTQFSQVNNNIIQGVAKQIQIKEGLKDATDVKSIADVFFLTRAASNPHIVFTAFNDLALADKHPMKILGQLFKGLSVGQEGENYHYAYDSMQRTYSYQHHGKRISRISQTTTANLNQLANTLQNTPQNMLWQVDLDSNCLPQSLISEEYQAISAAGHSGYIKFHIQAQKIPLFTQTNNLQLTNYTNSQNHWQSQTIATEQFEQEVQSTEEMWQIFEAFSQSKNTAKLIKAADFLINQISPDELGKKLQAADLGSSIKRDISFALSLSNHEDVENYIIDTLRAINSAQTNMAHSSSQVELQQVRLMVALSSSSNVTEVGFQALSNLAKDTSQDDNIRSNALINQASSLQQMKNQGQDLPYLEDQLSHELGLAINSEYASSAILAAGNSQLTELEPLIIKKLSSINDKERYAATTVLARNPENNDRLIAHLTSENSDLVSYSILTNLDVSSLTDEQKNDLRLLSSNTSEDISQLIAQLVK